MAQKVKIGEVEYNIDDLSEAAKAKVVSLHFADSRLRELTNMTALLQRAKQSYIDSLKREMISDKAGVLFEEE